MTTKVRLSATVDPALLSAARDAVGRGAAPSVSAWVEEALRRQAEHDAGLAALDRFVALVETEDGPVTDQLVAESRARLAARTTRPAAAGATSAA